MFSRIVCLVLLLSLSVEGGLYAQESDDAVFLSLNEAQQIALAKGYAVRQAKINIDEADGLIQQGWSTLFPQVNFSSSYTRNVRSANPFSGSDAGGFFASFAFVDWLAFNENARTDSDPGTLPITLADFFDRRNQGLIDAGIETSQSDNPFAVPNQVISGISVEQKVFDISAFLGASGGARYLRAINDAGLRRAEQLIVDETVRAYFGALLAAKQAEVIRASVGRTARTLAETSARVSQGILPKYSRLSAQVALSNLESQLIQSDNLAKIALDNLKLTIGLPVSEGIELTDELDDVAYTEMMTATSEDFASQALQRRPDYEQATLNVELENLRLKVEKGGYYPSLSAFANMNYIGNVPDNRKFTITDPDDPFLFTAGENKIFSDSYWDFTFAVGLSLRWTLFNGRQTSALVQQRRAARNRAELLAEQLEDGIRIEVEAARSSLVAARARIVAQEENVEAAELNYQYASTRLNEGVASNLDERQASELLDQSRLAYYQAVHDYLVAESALKTAVGMSAGPDQSSQSNSN